MLLVVSRGKTKYALCCNLFDVNVHPLLGRKAYICMQLIRALDSDDVNQSYTEGHPVFAVERGDQALSKQQVVKTFPKVFADSVGNCTGSECRSSTACIEMCASGTARTDFFSN